MFGVTKITSVVEVLFIFLRTDKLNAMEHDFGSAVLFSK
jgi:hypothetical protein